MAAMTTLKTDKYLIYYDFMSEEERIAIINYFIKHKDERDQAQLTGLYAPYTAMLELPTAEEFPLLHEVINRAHAIVGLLDKKEIVHGSGIRYGSGFAFYHKNSKSTTHKDPLDHNKYPGKSLFRTNIVFQVADEHRGGEFYFVEDDIDVPVPVANGCLICFSASDHLHGVSVNTGSTTRITMLLDCLVDTAWVEQFMQSAA